MGEKKYAHAKSQGAFRKLHSGNKEPGRKPKTTAVIPPVHQSKTNNILTMKTPKQIIVSTTNVHKDEITELIVTLADMVLTDGIRYNAGKGQEIIISNFNSLYTALKVMTYLEKNCWKWEDKA